MKPLLLFGLLFLPLVHCKWHRNWEAYKAKFGKSYSPEEELMRKMVFLENAVSVFAHNEETDEGEHSHTLGVNQYSDMMTEEFTKLMNGFLRELSVEKVELEVKKAAEPFVYKATVPDGQLPKSVDWRQKNVVTVVRDQGRCGSCWAFSAAGAMESAWAIKTGNLITLSPQNLLDCVNRQSDSCDGGDMQDAFEYVTRNDSGIDKEACYRYRGRQLARCYFRKNCQGANFTNYAVIAEGDEAAMKQAVALEGPISAALNADMPDFQHYKSGVYQRNDCGTEVTHGILIVGYGTTKSGQDYWIIKNSWNTNWGDEGFFKLARNENMCGIADMVSFPIV